eukprot:scaffold48329_cov45-Phaeocystis_antarctica.AAC.3
MSTVRVRVTAYLYLRSGLGLAFTARANLGGAVDHDHRVEDVVVRRLARGQQRLVQRASRRAVAARDARLGQSSG